MSDDFDLDDLKSAMNTTTPAPDAQRRIDNIALAQKNFVDLQGSRNAARPTTRPNTWTGVKTMLNTLTSRAGLTFTTAIVACGFMIGTPQGRDILNLAPTAKLATPETPVAIVVAPSDSVSVAARQADEGEMSDPIMEMAPAVVMEETATHIRDEDATLVPQAAPAPQQLTRAAPAGNDMAGNLRSMAEPSNDGFVHVLRDGSTFYEEYDETFANDTPNPLKITSDEPVSTFSIDVDTAAYALIRSSLTRGQLPPTDAVRIEEMINYFPYAYPAPEGEAPFRPTINVFETPWNADTQLVHIGIQGEMPAIEDRPPLNLVFLIDTSGSMESADKLPLLRQSFRLMLDNLRPEDEVAIVTYAGSTSIALEPTQASERATIIAALNALNAGGSTNGQGGLEQAYALAETMKTAGDVSRVILATDGDFNVGLSDPRGLQAYIEDKRDDAQQTGGTYLSVLGFGRGNLQDATMQSLAQNGNGTAAYIDTLSEAQKVLVDNLTGALFPIANDVKIQVEFNPATIAEYRLIGYETRSLNREDFNNDAVDAGELGAGHTVTAIYEITPVGSPAQLSDPLRYQASEPASGSDELGFLRLRYKAPGESVSQLIETPFAASGTPGTEALFAASMAGFGQLLRNDTYLGDWGWDDAIALASENRGIDQFGYRTEAVQLMRLAQSLSN
ncbi:magnesium-chelatase [Octadecabacter antarcticus 307]|uniref:Magnesium-chelatase n=1 Tax=Octadecabacter antarcticus 307 TaxID=391626 RepID=M9R9I4_9RHOB|nr:VWA domain-containing protein [Octadecabacter antarcticus]AGI66405.1 magnesium-chelatase [Octadecabacter antarcticus 307]